MTRRTRLQDYPPGVQDLLTWAYHHLEQLGRLEREFRAWQAAQGETGTAAVCIIDAQGQQIELFAPSTQGTRPTRPKVLPTESSIQPPARCNYYHLTDPDDRPKSLTD